ncbi:MAG: glycosyltransferase family 2 protein [Clostridiaceae bacterium]
MKNNKKASLIIPTYNKASRLKLTLLSLTKLEELENVEIIVVNDGSTDETNVILDEFKKSHNINLKIINIENSGRSVARNIGLKEAKGEIAIFTDDDLILSPTFIKEHIMSHTGEDNILVHGCIYNLPFLKFFNNPEIGDMIDGSERKDGLNKYILSADLITNNKYDQLENQKRLTKFEKDILNLLNNSDFNNDNIFRWICCTGGNFSVKKAHIDDVGGFDENLGKEWGCEDLELGYRLSLKNVKFKLNINAVNFHMSHYRKDTEEIHKKAFNYFIKKYNDKKIEYLLDYFEGKISSLIDWHKKIVGEN